MAVPVNCACGAFYNLKDQYAGRLIECPACHRRFRTPERQVLPLFDRDIFQLREKHFAIDTKYHVRDESGLPLLYVERPARLGERFLLVAVPFAALLYLVLAFAAAFPNFPWGGTFYVFFFAIYLVNLRRHIMFYADDRKQTTLLTVTQDCLVQFPSLRYTLHDEAGHVLATFRKNRFTDFLRKRWRIYTPDGTLLLTAREDSIILSLIRRLTGFLIDLAVFRTNFVIYAADGEQVLGEFNRKMTIFDRYTLDMSEDADRIIDRRIALALGVLLDTGEGR